MPKCACGIRLAGPGQSNNMYAQTGLHNHNREAQTLGLHSPARLLVAQHFGEIYERRMESGTMDISFSLDRILVTITASAPPSLIA
jgi:hypothetical protein